jgi:transposase-like protein
MSTHALFKWRHFLPKIILLNVRWYCRYALSDRALEAMMPERGVAVDHSTSNRWALKYALEPDQQMRRPLKPTNDLWSTDETDIKSKGAWKDLDRAVASEGHTLDFLLSAKRDGKAAAHFFRKVLRAQHTQTPRVLNVDKHAADPVARATLKGDKTMEKETEMRQSKSLNHIIEQDHRTIKRLVKPMMGYQAFDRARRTLSGIEAMHTVKGK